MSSPQESPGNVESQPQSAGQQSQSEENLKNEQSPQTNNESQPLSTDIPSNNNTPIEENNTKKDEDQNNDSNDHAISSNTTSNTNNNENNNNNNEPPQNQESDSDSSSNPALTALGEYCPFIADVPISSYADPFPIPHPDTRSDAEIEKVKKALKKSLKSKKFDPPIPLADFCLIAKERWDQEDSDSEASIGLCLLI